MIYHEAFSKKSLEKFLAMYMAMGFSLEHKEESKAVVSNVFDGKKTSITVFYKKKIK